MRDPDIRPSEPRTYGSGMSKRGEDVTRCIESVADTSGWYYSQCSRKRGHGPSGLWCKQHDPDAVKAKRAARSAAWDAKWAAESRERRYGIEARAYVRFRAAAGDAEAAAILARAEVKP